MVGVVLRYCICDLWDGYGQGTSPEGRPIMTQGSNCYCCTINDEQLCIQRLFGMPRTMDVPMCRFWICRAGYGDDTSPEGRPFMTQWSNEESRITSGGQM